MLKPLKQFICDECGKVIERPEEGFLEWFGTIDHNIHVNMGFRIVHARSFSPLKEVQKDGCFLYGSTPYKRDMHLDDVMKDCAQYLLRFLDLGPFTDPNNEIPVSIKNFREFNNLFRRLTVPYYEEARLFIQEADKEGFLDSAARSGVYSEEILKAIIEKYSWQEGIPVDPLAIE